MARDEDSDSDGEPPDDEFDAQSPYRKGGRWQKNCPSPWPSGRPPKPKAENEEELTLLRAVEEELNKQVKLNGKRRKKSKGELLISRIRTDAAGKAKSIDMLEKVQAQKPKPVDSNVRPGVLLIPRGYMTEEEWMIEFGGEKLTKDPLEGLPGIDAAMMERAMAEKRRLCEEGYNDENDEECA